jgi:hypothetical protein
MPSKKTSKKREGFGENEQGITSNNAHRENALNIVAAMNGDIDAILNMTQWEGMDIAKKVRFVVKKVGILPEKNKKNGICEFDPRLDINISLEEYEQEIGPLK